MGTRRSLYGWLTAESLSLTGTRVSMIALPWFVLTTTGSATKTGLVAFAELTPLVLLQALGGPIIDRVGPRRVAVTCDLTSVVAVGLVPVLHAFGALPFPLLLALVAVAGALRGPGDAAKSAMIPTIAEQAGVPTERVTGLGSAVERTATTLGAAFAGGLVALVGPAQALIVDALSFLLCAVVLAWSTRDLAPPVAVRSERSPTGYLQELREGWRFIRHDRLLLGLMVMIALANLLDQAWTVVLVPVWAQSSGGGAALVGLVFAVFSAASIAGSLVAAGWGVRIPRFRTYLIAYLVCGLPKFATLALGAPLWVVLGVCVVGGVASGFLNPILGAVKYERIPRPLIGRVGSLMTAACFALMPLGGLVGGVLVSGIGLSPALLAIGAAYLVVTMAPALDPAFRAMDERADWARRRSGASVMVRRTETRTDSPPDGGQPTQRCVSHGSAREKHD